MSWLIFIGTQSPRMNIKLGHPHLCTFVSVTIHAALNHSKRFVVYFNLCPC